MRRAARTGWTAAAIATTAGLGTAAAVIACVAFVGIYRVTDDFRAAAVTVGGAFVTAMCALAIWLVAGWLHARRRS